MAHLTTLVSIRGRVVRSDAAEKQPLRLKSIEPLTVADDARIVRGSRLAAVTLRGRFSFSADRGADSRTLRRTLTTVVSDAY